MVSDPPVPFAAYPMVGEAQATGVVAAVYADLRARRPFVPSLFKSLALCPGYLVLASEQVRDVLDDERFTASARDLAASVHGVSQPPMPGAVREALARFVAPVSQVALLASGLLLALRGDLDAPPAPGRAPASRPLDTGTTPPSPQEAAAAELYGQIRAALRTPIINTVWRELAAAGQLADAWAVLGWQVPAALPAAAHLQHRVLDAARRVPWRVAACPVALARAGVSDAAPGMAAVLDAYAVTLPRVLVLVASSASGGGDEDGPTTTGGTDG